MSAITLHRTDAARNMHRYYRLDVQPDLFGEWCFVREWGRIGRPGQMRSVPYPTEQEAHAALARQRRVKERRGYLLQKRGSSHLATLILRTTGLIGCISGVSSASLSFFGAKFVTCIFTSQSAVV